MKKTLTQHHRIEILVHIISWSIFFAFPLLIADRNNNTFNWTRYLYHSIVPFSFMVVFYINYFLLIPRILFREQPYRYILYNVLLVTGVALLLYLWQNYVIPPPTEIYAHRRSLPPKWSFIVRDVLSLLFAAALSAVIRISGRWTHLESARREAEKSRTEAELKNLRNQLNPHFLLNTLNNIYALIAFDTDKAQQAVQELSKLLRHMLYDNQQTFTPLGREAGFIHNYIELMRIRLSPNVALDTQINVDKESHTPIAPLIFISLIENAFKHGISPTEASSIHILLAEEKGEVICEITNTNYPKSNTDKSGSGIGLPQVSKRLELLYPGRYSWEKGVRKDGKEYYSRLRISPDYTPKP